MFWEKKSNGQKMLPHKGIPETVGRHLIVGLGKNPDLVWNLKAGVRNNGNEKDVFEVIVFDPSQAVSQKIKVENYDSFNEHPELILYEGWFNKRTLEVKVQARKQLSL